MTTPPGQPAGGDPWQAQPPPPAGYGMPPPPPGYGMPPQGYGAQPRYGQPRPRNGLAVASLLIGLVSVPAAIVLVGVVPAVLAVILGVVALKRAARGEATSRVPAVVGIAAGVLGAFLAGLMLAYVATHTDELGGLKSCLEEAGQSREAREACNRAYEVEAGL